MRSVDGPACASVVAFLLYALGSSHAWAAPPPGSQWELTWSDEFNGTAVDTTHWGYWLDGQTRRAAVNRAANTFVRNGNLTVRIGTDGGQLTSGGVQSKAQFGYGYFEVRAQVLGGWAGFWMQSPAVDGVGDPAANGTEMDIQEACCPGAVQHAVHWNGYGADHKFVTHAISSDLVVNQKDFNVYGLEWKAGQYNFWVNDRLSWTFTDAVSARKDEWIRLTQETDGDSCGGECLYVVDYVRVYANRGPAAAAGSGGMGGVAATAGAPNGGAAGTNTGGTAAGGLAAAGSGGGSGNAFVGTGGFATSGAASVAGQGNAGLAGTSGSHPHLSDAASSDSEASCSFGSASQRRTSVLPFALGVLGVLSYWRRSHRSHS